MQRIATDPTCFIRPSSSWEAGLAHYSRQNESNPIIWHAGQDYRTADAIQTARQQPTHIRHSPERVGPER